MRFRAAQKQPRARNTHHKKARLHRCKRARLSESVEGKPVRGTGGNRTLDLSDHNRMLWTKLSYGPRK